MTLAQWYKRNADATGHAPSCRRRSVDMAEHRALDCERCERCAFLAERLADAALGYKVAP